MTTINDAEFEASARLMILWFDSPDSSLTDIMNKSDSESDSEPEPKTDIIKPEPKTDIIKPEPHPLTEYIQSYKKMGFVPIPFKEMKLNDNKKCYYGLPYKWSKLKITDETNPNPEDTCLCILTGKPSGITVLDFDSEMLYLDLLREHPEIKDCYTIKTRRGYHVYFKYNEFLKEATDVCNLIEKGLDIKNNGGHCTTAPSQYDDIQYQHYNGDKIIEIPDYVLDLINESGFKNAKVIPEENLEEIPEENLEEKTSIYDMETKMKIVDLINVSPYLDSYSSWKRIMFAMKHEGLSKEFAKKISQKSTTYTDKGFDSHWDGAPSDINVKVGSLIRYAKLSKESECLNILKEFRQANKKEKQVVSGFYEKAKEFESLGNGKLQNGKYVSMDEDNRPIIINRREMFDRFEHLSYKMTVDGTPKMMPFINKWMSNNPNIQMFKGVDVFPTGMAVPKGYINLWSPFKMELIDKYTPMPEVVEFMNNHLRIMCDNEEPIFNYLNTWMAHILHRPSIKTERMPIIISRQGAGKTSVLELIRAMIGTNHIADISDPKTVIGGDFNGPLLNSYIVHMSELSKSKIDVNKLKHMITEKHAYVVKKGKDPVKIRSFHQFIGLTNNQDLVPTSDDDRRLFIIRASDQLIGDTEYFNKFYNYINNEDAMKTLYEHYRTVKIPDNFNKSKPPTTAHHQELKSMNRPPIALWLEQFIINAMDNCDDTTGEYNNASLYQKFKSWKETNGINYDLNSQQFNMRIHGLRLDGMTTKKTRTCNLRVINFAKVLESLKTCV